MDILESWRKRFEDKHITVVLNGRNGKPGGSKCDESSCIVYYTTLCVSQQNT